MHDRDDPEAASYVPPRLTSEQLRAIERRIISSRDASQFAKRVIVWLLRQTDGLTKPVSLSMPSHFCGGTAEEVQDAAHDMVSAHGSTHLDEFLAAMGTEVRLEHHAGGFLRRADGTVTHDFGHHGDDERTIWWSHVWYDRDTWKLDPPTADELAAID